MTLAKRHFEELASKLRGARETVARTHLTSRASADFALNLMEIRLANFCAAETPTFDRARFIEAARLEE
jgi:hypothetical protein